jgi:hypothetical protein
MEANSDILVSKLDEMHSIPKMQQHYLIILRIIDRLEGRDGSTHYKNRHFFQSMKELEKAGWVKKRTKLNDNNKPSTYYELTGNGLKFNAMMMQHPEYKALWSMMKHKKVVY